MGVSPCGLPLMVRAANGGADLMRMKPVCSEGSGAWGGAATLSGGLGGRFTGGRSVRVGVPVRWGGLERTVVAGVAATVWPGSGAGVTGGVGVRSGLTGDVVGVGVGLGLGPGFPATLSAGR